MSDPWDEFQDAPRTGFVAGDPGNSVAVAAPVAAGQTPVTSSDPYSQFQDARPVQQSAGGELEGHFGDDALPPDVATRLSPDDEAHLHQLYKTGTIGDILAFQHSKGLSTDTKQLAVFVADRDHPRPGPAGDDSVKYALAPAPDEGKGMAAVRGAADVVPGATKVAAAMAAAGDALAGKTSFGDAYNRHLDLDNAQVGGDEQDHPWARVGGQLLGGLLVPSGLEGVGLKAGTDVLKLGGTIQEARVAASIAVRNRMALVGGAYSGFHGAAGADNIPDAITSAVTQGAVGAVTGGLVGTLGARMGQRASIAANGAQDVAQNEVAPATADDAARIAGKYNIPATPATVGGPVAHAVQMGLGNLPGGMSAVATGVGAENEGVANAVRNVAGSVGTASTREGAGQAAIEGARDYSRTSRAQGGALYQARDDLMGGEKAPVTLDDTKKQLTDITAKYPNSDTLKQLMQHPVIRKIAGVADDASQPDGVPAELTLGEATDALSHVRGVARQLAKNGTDPDTVTASVGGMKDALTSDVYRAAAAADQAAGREAGAPGSAVDAQQKADAFWADRKQALSGTLKAPMTAGAKPTEMPAERVYGQIDADTQLVGGNLARLRDTWFRLPPASRNTIAATKIDDMGRSLPGAQDNTGNAWSFERYLTNFNKMAPQARNIMFGADAASQLHEIAAYSSRLRDLGKSRNFSNTAKNMAAGAILSTLGGALWHGAPLEAAASGVAIPATFGAATLFLKTPAMRQWTASALRAAAVADPARSVTLSKAALARLPLIARAEPAIADEVLALHQKLSGLAASSRMNVAAADKPADGVAQAQGNASDQQAPAQSAQP